MFVSLGLSEFDVDLGYLRRDVTLCGERLLSERLPGSMPPGDTSGEADRQQDEGPRQKLSGGGKPSRERGHDPFENDPRRSTDDGVQSGLGGLPSAILKYVGD